GLSLDLLAATDEDLQMHGLGRLYRFAERRIVSGHLAPAQERHALAGDHLGVDVADHPPPVRIARHEQRADRIFAGLRQAKAETVRLLDEELVRDLYQNARAVAGARIGANRPAVFEIAEDGERILDQLVRFPALDVGNETDAAGVLLERGIVKPTRGWQTRGIAPADPKLSLRSPLTLTYSRCALACRAHCRPRVSTLAHRRHGVSLGASFAPATPIGVTASRVPLVWRPFRYRAWLRRLAARVRQSRERAMARFSHRPVWAI